MTHYFAMSRPLGMLIDNLLFTPRITEADEYFQNIGKTHGHDLRQGSQGSPQSAGLYH